MKRVSFACLVAVALFAFRLGLTAAENAKFRYVTSVYFDDKGVGFNLPEAVACGANGAVVVGDTGNDRLFRFTIRDKTVSGGAVIKVPELTAPSRVHLTSKGEILALDGRQRRIVRIGADGEFKGPVAYEGVPAPATIVPKSFAIDAADNLYVLDVFSARVLVLSAQGKFQRALPLPAEAGFISDVAADQAGGLLLLDSVGRRLFAAARDATAFAPLGKDLTDSLATLPTSLTTSKGVLFIAEGPGSSIVTVGRDGTFLTKQLSLGWEEGAINYPSQVCVNGQDDAFVADRDNSRIQVYKLVR